MHRPHRSALAVLAPLLMPAAIVRPVSDAPGYDRADTRSPFGFGLSY